MIVRAASGHLLLITQPDHAALAAEIVAAWRADGLPVRASRDTVLLATREHDNGWQEVDGSPAVDSEGRPYDFIGAPVVARQGIWPRGVERMARRSAYAAALIAQHALTVYGRYRGQQAWRTFFDDLTTRRDALLDRAGVRGAAMQAFDADYRMVYLGDFLSLIFCAGWTDAFDEQGYRLTLEGDLLRVSPDPFGGARLPLRIRARRILDRRYASDGDLQAEIARADEVALTGTAVGD